MTKFISDFRTENPKLHELYVRYAYEELMIVDEAIKQLSDMSRVSASILAGALFDKRQELVQEDASFWDAAAMIHAGIPLPEEPVIVDVR